MIIRTSIFSAWSLVLLTSVSAVAQQTTGVPGSPSATTTIDGSYLPNPPPKFGGTINLGAAESKPFWRPQVAPPQGAPNVLLIMTDDAGYGVSGTFGGVIPTPVMGCDSASSSSALAVQHQLGRSPHLRSNRTC